MVNLKRIMAGIIAGATVVSMAACSNGTTDGTSTSSDTKQRLMTRLKIRSALAI